MRVSWPAEAAAYRVLTETCDPRGTRTSCRERPPSRRRRRCLRRTTRFGIRILSTRSLLGDPTAAGTVGARAPRSARRPNTFCLRTRARTGVLRRDEVLDPDSTPPCPAARTPWLKPHPKAFRAVTCCPGRRATWPRCVSWATRPFLGRARGEAGQARRAVLILTSEVLLFDEVILWRRRSPGWSIPPRRTSTLVRPGSLSRRGRAAGCSREPPGPGRGAPGLPDPVRRSGPDRLPGPGEAVRLGVRQRRGRRRLRHGVRDIADVLAGTRRGRRGGLPPVPRPRLLRHQRGRGIARPPPCIMRGTPRTAERTP